MKKHVLLYEEFAPKDTDSVDSWDIPTSKNCIVKDITLIDEDGGKAVYNQENNQGLLVGDIFYNTNRNNGYQYDMKRQWIDSSLGNIVMNFLQKNYRNLKKIVAIEVNLVPQGGKKSFKLEYYYIGNEYRLRERRYLPLT